MTGVWREERNCDFTGWVADVHLAEVDVYEAHAGFEDDWEQCKPMIGMVAGQVVRGWKVYK